MGNIMGCILSQELKADNILVQMMHPGFNRTAMTQKYAHIWDIEGAVEPHIGCKRVLYETSRLTCPPRAPSSTARTASASRGKRRDRVEITPPVVSVDGVGRGVASGLVRP